jgi:adenylosuccinate lyase
MEDVALWHERDISHSSVERVILPDASIVAHYLLVRTRRLIDGMTVHADRMLENLERSYGLVFSQPVLLALVAAGMTRDAAYRIVQRNAMASWEQRKPFRSLLESDPEVTVPESVLDDAFSLERSLRNTDHVFDALEGVE